MQIKPRRLSLVRALGVALSGLLAVGVITAVQAPASADTNPPTANDPANPETVAAKPLPTVQIDGVAWTQAVVGNTVYVGGAFTTARPAGSAPGVNTVSRANLLAYDIRTGDLINSWAPTTNGDVLTLKPSPDGSRIYIGGTFTKVGTSTRNRVAALNATTGAVISTFNPNVDARVKAIAVTSDTVYIGGLFSKINQTLAPQARSRLAAFGTDGSVKPWAPAAAGGAVAALATLPDGTVVAGGQFTTLNGSGNPGYGLGAIDGTTGALKPWAANSLIRDGGTQSGINSLTTDGDSVYATGYVFGPGGNLEGTARMGFDGSIQWVEDCHGDTYGTYSRGGAVYAVSHAHYCGNVPGGFAQPTTWRYYRGMAFSKATTGTLRQNYSGSYFNWDGTASPSILQWFPQFDATGTATGQNQAAWAITGNADYIVAGGEFPKVGSTAQQGLVRFAAKSAQPDTLAPQYTIDKWVPTVASPGSGEVSLTWQANYDRDSRDLTYKVIRNSDAAHPVYTTTQGSNAWDRPFMNFRDTGRTPGSTVTYRVTATDKAGNEAKSSLVSVTVAGSGATDAYTQSVLQDGPQSYWRADEGSGSTIDDLASNDDMVDANNAQWSTDGAIAGRGGSVQLPTTGSPFASTRKLQEAPWWYTVEGWFHTTTTKGGRIVGFGGSATGSSSVNQSDRAVYMSNNGQLNFGSRQGSSFRTVTSGTSYNDGGWHHFAGTVDDDGMNLYVDGARVGERSDTRTAGPYSGYWRIGGDSLQSWANRPTSDYFSGQVDEVAVYQRALTGNQVRAHYDASGRTLTGRPTDAYGKGVYDDGASLYWRLAETAGTSAADSSQNGSTGSYVNGPTLGGASAVNVTDDHSVDTDGTNDNVALNQAQTLPARYSSEMWFKTSSTSGGELVGFGSSKTGASTKTDRYLFMTTGGKLRFGVSPSAGESAIESPSSYNDGAWHHVVTTQGTGGMTLYVDGKAVASGPMVNSSVSSVSTAFSGYWRVGGDSLANRASRPTSDYLNGSLDEVAIYPKALSAAQVLSHFVNGGGTPANGAPTAAFTESAQGKKVTFDGSTSSDTDGTVASYAWDFGDGTTGTGVKPVHTYADPGSYTVALTVTDNGNANSAPASHGVTVTNTAPVAEFSSTVDHLVATFNAAQSSDSDGTIASYAWDFGDGKSGTGLNPNHEYALPGTYTVKLTVVDDDNTSSTVVTHTVTATATGTPTTVAADAFGRTVTGGWGSADTGGPWTKTAGTAASLSVGSGAGSMTLLKGATTSVALNSVSELNTDAVLTMSLPKIVDGGGEFTSLGARQVGTNGYRVKVKVGSAGRVTLTLVRVVNNVETVVGPASGVMLPSAVTMAANSQLKVRLNTQGTAPTSLNARAWLAGTTEPTTWQISATDSTAALQVAGSVFLSTYVSGSATFSPVVKYDDLLVTKP